MSDLIVQLTGITKKYYGNKVLDQVDFDLCKGEVHSLIGENGSGKTTLMKILSGAIRPNSGSIIFDGQAVSFEHPKQALKVGIGMVYQDITLFPDLSVAENIFFGHESKKKLLHLNTIDYKQLNLSTKDLLESFSLDLDPETLVENLSQAQQRAVEILRTISQNNKVIILDEPNGAFSYIENEYFFKLIEQLKAKSISIVFISHSIADVYRISDRISVIRNGKIVSTTSPNEEVPLALISKMVGDNLRNGYPRLELKKGQEILRLDNVSVQNILRNVNLSIKEGELVGLTGLMGSGRTALAKTIFGTLKIDSGCIYLNGQPTRIKNPRQAIRAGISYIASDRLRAGLIGNFNIGNNIAITDYTQISKFSVISNSRTRILAEKYIKALKIKVFDADKKVMFLSGGNQQKVVLAKWFHTDAMVFIMDEPTAGIDIASKVDIYNIMNKLKMDGVGILFISSDIKGIEGHVRPDLCHGPWYDHSGVQCQ